MCIACIENKLVLNLHQQNGELAQLARALRWQRRGHRFESGILHKGTFEKVPFVFSSFLCLLSSMPCYGAIAPTGLVFFKLFSQSCYQLLYGFFFDRLLYFFRNSFGLHHW